MLQRGGGVIALGIEKLDLPPCLFRHVAAEGGARFEEPLLNALVEDIETMARRDQLERQRQQFLPLFTPQRRDAAAVEGAQNGGERRQIIGADEAELLKKFMLVGQVGEHLGHHRGNLPADVYEIVGQPDLVEDLQHIGVVGKRLEVENRPDRRPEKKVFGDARIGVVLLDIIGLDEFGDVVRDQTAGERVARSRKRAVSSGWAAGSIRQRSPKL